MYFFDKISSKVTGNYEKFMKEPEQIDPDLWQSNQTYKPGDEVKINK